jgi:integrating conjugative element relaxase (TIGR03760 family)
MDFLLVLAVLLLAASIVLQLRSSGQLKLPQLASRKAAAEPILPSSVPQQSAAAPVAAASSAAPAPKVLVEGRAAGHLKVLDHEQLLQVTGAHQLLEHLARHSRLSKQVFERDFLSALRQYVEFVQLMPASEAHHHANVGGLLAHTLETTYHALVLRGGYLLPRNGGAEIIDAQRDFWTYAIFFGAMLHDVGKPLTDLRIEMRLPGSTSGTRWLPMSGSLVECGAEQYRVTFAPKSERDYGAHGKMGVVLLQRLVPASALNFLGRCPDVLQELTQFLGGDARQGVIAEIVGKADQTSTKNNLAQGSRARFSTARSVPLVEQLMTAMQDMLRAGGQLPLNRDGAVGWVFDGSIWFVAKRLADTVRQYILARAGDEAGIPGENKNDRLFDTWQEYGQLVPNPATQQAIWHVIVHGEDGQGYSHNLSVLRFPLEKVWPAGPDAYPQAMAGRIEVLNKRRSEADNKDSDAAAPSAAAPAATVAKPVAAAATSSGQSNPTVSSKSPPLEIPAPKFGETAKKPNKRTLANAVSQDDDILPEDESALAGVKASKRSSAAPSTQRQTDRSSQPTAPTLESADHSVEPAPTEAHDPDPGLDGSLPWEADDGAPSPPPSAPISRAVLHQDASPIVVSTKLAREPSAAAIAFMQWVQRGLGDGSLKYNEAGAPVHFVEAGMALVSPAIFRDYAVQFGEPSPVPGTAAAKTIGPERIGLAIQREVLRAGWHAPSPADGTNIWTFTVSRRGGTKKSKLSAVVLADSRRWVMEPPPPNPTLQLPSAAEPTA